MDNRFGVKDFFLLLILSVLIIVVILAMFQYDRQWKQLSLINEELRNQTRDLSSIRQLLADGSFASRQSTTPTTRPAGFEVTQQSRLEAVTKMPGYSPGDWLVQAVGSPPTKLTPLIDTDLFGSRIQDLVFDSLAVRNPETLGFMPCVSESWEQSADGNEVIFHMRRNVVFSDGTPMTADDVKYTFDLVLNKDIEAERARVYLENVDKVTVVDPYTVKFNFKKYYFQNFEAVGTTPILSKKFYSQFSAVDFNNSVGLILGSGPYRVADPKAWKYEPGKPFELQRNERHWGVRPAFDRVIWYMQPDPSARLISFKNGDTDRFGAQPEQYRDLIKDEKLMAKVQKFQFVAPDDGYNYIGWNQIVNGKKTPFADKRVRQAMTMLIDREAIARDIFYGYAKVAVGPFDPNGPQHNKTIKAWPFDPTRAKALLADAGYTDRNGDGIVDGPDGKSFSFKLNYPSSSTLSERICLLIKDSMRKGGVLCETEPLEWSVLLERLRQKQIEAQISGWGGSVEGDLYQIFHSSGIEGMGDNRVSYSNPELDKLIEQARSTVDEKQRNDLWKQCETILHEDQPYTFLLNNDNLLMVNNRFQNVKTDLMGINTASIREWFVPADKQKWGR